MTMRPILESLALSLLLVSGVGCHGTNADTQSVTDAGSSDGPQGYGRTVTRIGSGLGNPLSIAVDSRYAYVTPAYPGTSVMRVPLDGGHATLVASSAGPGSLAIDDVNAYWTDNDVDGGSVLSVPKGGGAVTTLASGLSSPGPVTVQGSTVYWASAGAGGAPCDAGCAGGVASVSTKGGQVTTLFSALASSFPQGLVAQGTSVYLATSDGRIIEVPEDGGPSKMLWYELTSDQGIAADAAYVYWVNTAGDVMRIAHGGGKPTPLAYSQQSSAIAVDATGVYWANGGDGTVMTAPLDGGTPVTLVAGLRSPYGIAIDSTSVYWFDGQGEVWAATPK